MAKHVKWTPQRLFEIKTLYLSGITITALSSRYDVSERIITNQLRKVGIRQERKEKEKQRYEVDYFTGKDYNLPPIGHTDDKHNVKPQTSWQEKLMAELYTKHGQYTDVKLKRKP